VTSTAHRRSRPYLFYDVARTLCSRCLFPIEGKIVFEGERVLLDKWCPHHGRERVLLSDDVAYWRRCREVFVKHAEMPERFQTGMRWGCPFDCGLCPDHQQHSCVTLVEINDHCNLACPVCYATSGPHRPNHRSLAEVEAMLDATVSAEGRPDVVQISGGEPTTHPELFAILAAARRRPIRHLMLNTNGVRLATEPDFARRLADAVGRDGFEVYLQFDSLRDDVLQHLRGARLSRIRQQALERLEEAGLSTTLVVTLEKGRNDDEIGAIIDHALTWRCVRGVTLQPVQEAGRLEDYDPAVHRLTVSEVRRGIHTQSPHFTEADLVPVPCHPEALCMGYALKLGGQVVPLTRYARPEQLLSGPENTIVLEEIPALKDAVGALFSTGIGPVDQAAKLKDLLCCLPRIDVPGLGYENVFRVMIVRFMDARDFDVRSVKRSCLMFAQPDGRLIPFDTWNLLYRNPAESGLDAIRALLRSPDSPLPG
jgi:uncharacterized radical SAM superfamily Fe-S cluster-containing enzyme